MSQKSVVLKSPDDNKLFGSTTLSMIFREELVHTITFATDLIFFVDFFFYAKNFPYKMFRYSRLLRPIKVVIHSKQLKSTVISFINITSKIIDVFLFFLFISLFFGFIGYQIFQGIPPPMANIKEVTISLNLAQKPLSLRSALPHGLHLHFLRQLARTRSPDFERLLLVSPLLRALRPRQHVLLLPDPDRRSLRLLQSKPNADYLP